MTGAVRTIFQAFQASAWPGLAATVGLLATTPALAATDPWELLESVRERLSRSPLTAEFIQEFRPAGFASSDRESGAIRLSLPGCLRWDYEMPFEKTFLVCDETVHAWNAGETSGRRFLLPSGDEPGLDLLRLRVDQLRVRYTAALTEQSATQVQVVLTPRAEDAPLVEAMIWFDPRQDLPSGLAYRDREGNESRFEFTAYRPAAEHQCCRLPPEMNWIDE